LTRTKYDNYVYIISIHDFLQTNSVSSKSLLKACNEAILTYPLYENLRIVPTAMALCKAASDADKDLAVDTVLKLISSPDSQARNTLFFFFLMDRPRSRLHGPFL
jgi:hypothetical protein